MKRAFLVIALAVMLVFAMGSAAFAKNAGSKIISDSSGWGNLGYINWSAGSNPSWTAASSAGSLDVAQNSGPHANYTTTTVKCAVCHSIHQAPQGSFLLTRVTGAPGTTPGAICQYCHNRTSTVCTLLVSFDPVNAPAQHSSYCTGTSNHSCHAGAHGVGVSTYPTLAAKLLAGGADAKVAAGIADTANTGVTAADFTIALGDTETNDQRTLAIGYTCGQASCHSNSAFVTKDGKAYNVAAPGGAPTAGRLSTHPMMDGNAQASLDTAFHGSYTGKIAWLPSNGCSKCHALQDSTLSKAAFPHDRNVPGMAAGDKSNGVWLVGAADALSATYSVKNHEYNPDGSAAAIEYGFSTAQDGVCLRCHRGSSTLGVGRTF